MPDDNQIPRAGETLVTVKRGDAMATFTIANDSSAALRADYIEFAWQCVERLCDGAHRRKHDASNPDSFHPPRTFIGKTI